MITRFIPIIFREGGRERKSSANVAVAYIRMLVAVLATFFFLFHRRYLNNSFDLAVVVQLAKPYAEYLKLWLFKSMSFHANSNLGAGGRMWNKLRRRKRMERRWRLESSTERRLFPLLFFPSSFFRRYLCSSQSATYEAHMRLLTLLVPMYWNSFLPSTHTHV